MCIECTKENFEFDEMMDWAINELMPVEVVSEQGKAVIISEAEWDYMRRLYVRFVNRSVIKEIDTYKCSLNEMIAKRIRELGSEKAIEADGVIEEDNIPRPPAIPRDRSRRGFRAERKVYRFRRVERHKESENEPQEN